jgi:putative zinc finger/helix-turn-helix YgiT family protein
MMKERTGSLSLPVNGEAVAVPSVPHLKCPKCRETVLRWEDSLRLSSGAHAIYRKKYGLLSPAEVQAVRRRLDMTQAQFARLLRLGSNTVSRWEAGRTVQMASMDVLLRLVRDVPETLRFLRKREG